MNRRGNRRLLLLMLSLLMVCSLLAWPAVAANEATPAEGQETAAGQETETDQETGGETEKPTGGEADSEEAGEENADGTDGESTEEEEPEPTLQELRDELLAILGSGEEAESVRANVDRLIALGDPSGTLRTYLESSIRLHQLQYEMEQLQATLDQLEASDGTIGAIGEAVTALENPDQVLGRIETEISDQAARLLESAGYDGTGDLALLASRVLAYLDAGAAGADSADMAAILLFQGLQESGVLNETGLVTAADAISAHFGNIAGRYRGLSSETRQTLEAASQEIAGRANKADALNPGSLIMAGNRLALTKAVFTYDGAIMVSLQDAAVFLGGEVVEMDDNATVVIQASGVVLEMTKGSSDAYLGDRLLKMEQPVLSFDKVCYLPLDTVLQCCGMERMTVGNYSLLYPTMEPAPEPTAEQEG